MALTQVSTGGVKDGTILNADINASAAIAGTKISPSFSSNIAINTSFPSLFLTDTEHNSDFSIQNQDGTFAVKDETNSTTRLTIASSGATTFTGNCDFSAGIDVTGDLTVSSSLAKIVMNDTDGGDQYQLRNDAGTFIIRNGTDSKSVLTIDGACVTSILNATPPATGVGVLHVSNNGSATTLGTAATCRVSNNGGNAAYSVFEAESGSGSIRLANDGQFYVTGNGNFSSRVRVDISTAVDGFMGEAYSGYFGLKHADQTLNSEYMIISNDTNTYISCSSGSSIYLRPSANNSSHELLVTTNVTLAKAAFGAGTTAIDPDSYTAYSGGFGSINDGGSWGARGMWVHGGGTGDAAAIAHNGSNLYFGLQNGSAANSMATYMMIEPTATGNICMEKNVKLTGTVLRRSQHQTGHFEGTYNNVGANDTKTNPIYTIGSSYNPAESTLANMYGIGFSHGNASFTPLNAEWGMYVCADGDARVYLDATHARIYLDSDLSNTNTDAMYLAPTTGDYGSIQINGGTTGGWLGYSIAAGAVFMYNGSIAGIFNDIENEWYAYGNRNGQWRTFYNGLQKTNTSNTGLTVIGTVNETSDIALKENIQPLTNALENLKKLKGYSYNFIDNKAKALGIVAQDVEKVYPDIVEGEEGEKSVAYSGLIAVLIEAIKELETEVAALKGS
jgi:hypothetical protein